MSLHWFLGDGFLINPLKDHWIPRELTLFLLPPKPPDSIIDRVADLFYPINRLWNEDVIQELWPDLAPLISSIRCPGSLTQIPGLGSTLSWHLYGTVCLQTDAILY